jgi:acetate kinase
MMTRSGDVDNEIILEMAKNYGVEETKKIINLKSGFQGICQSGDMLEVLDKIKNGDKNAKLALDIFTYQIKKYIGAYFAVLGGCDLLVFTGAIGFGSGKIRSMITKDLSILIKTKILAIKTDEELAIGQKIIKTL